LILMGRPHPKSESFGMGDFNFALTVIKMQRRARIAPLALALAGQATRRKLTVPPDLP
jgi:hypothetical protein